MTTYRLFPSTSGPGAPTAYSGAFVGGMTFKVTSWGTWFNGYYFWGTPGGDTTPVKCALWEDISATGGVGTVVPGSVVTSETLTLGQWNYIPLATPITLTSGGLGYVAAIGWTATNGFPDTQNQFGAGNPYASGITSGPLFAFSDNGASAPNPTNQPQGSFTTASADPSVSYPATSDVHSNFWVDVQVSDTAPAGAAYSLFPSQPYPLAWANDTADNFTLGIEFTLSQSCALNSILFFSPTGTSQLPTETGIWAVGSQTLVSGTHLTSPSWSGAAGSGWISVSYTGVTLAAGDYKATVFNGAGTPVIWNAQTHPYWNGGGQGASGITNGPLAAPNVAGATSPGQATYHLGATFTWPDTYASDLGSNYWVDVSVTPQATAPAQQYAYSMRRMP